MGHRTLATALVGVALLGAVAATPAAPTNRSADHEVELELGDTEHIDGGAPGGVNPGYFDATAGACNKDPHTYCELTHVHVVTEVPADVERGRLRSNLLIELTSPDLPVSDFDLIVWESDESGDRITEIARSASGGYVDAVESVNVVVSTTPEVQDAWYLVEVVYYLGGPNYDLDLEFA